MTGAGPESDLPAGLFREHGECADGPDNLRDLCVVSVESLLQLGEFCCECFAGSQGLPQA